MERVRRGDSLSPRQSMWRAWGAARRSGRRGDEPRAVTRGSRGVSWWTCHGTWRETPQVSSGSRITRSGGALGLEDVNLWCAVTPIFASARTQALLPVGRHDSPAGAHSARASLVPPTPSLSLQPRVVSLGRQLLRHRLRQQPRHSLPLVVAHRADDCLRPLRRHAALLASGCERGMRLWGQKHQTGVNAAFMTKTRAGLPSQPRPAKPEGFLSDSIMDDYTQLSNTFARNL